jgi:hypothetical protein
MIQVQSTFFFTLFPPPATGSDVFSGFNGSGAGGTANTDVAFLVQAVLWNMIFF